MPRSIATWSRLLGRPAQDLLDAAARCDASDVAAVSRLRRGFPVNLVQAALQLTEARQKARAKFGHHAEQLMADPQGVEQASSLRAARHKAARFAALTGQPQVLDLCCGIGGDAMALRDAGLDVQAFDIDPLRAWMTTRNAQCPAACADVTKLTIDAQPFHLDPARRGQTGRIWRLADYLPGPDFMRALLKQSANGAIKLGPGVDLSEAGALCPDGELEFLSEDGRLVQAVLWTGRLARNPRRATLLRADAPALTLTGVPAPPPVAHPGPFIFTVDPAIERARLLRQLCEELDAAVIHPAIGILTAARPVNSDWVTGFRLLETMPWRIRKIQQWLKAHDGGLVEVKTRDRTVDTDMAQQSLRGKGKKTYTVFALRFDEKVEALIAERLPD